MARLAHRADDEVRRARLPVREEARYGLMLVELLQRSGPGARRERWVGKRVLDILGGLSPSRSALSGAMAVIGEGFPDRLNRRLRRGVEDPQPARLSIADLHTPG